MCDYYGFYALDISEKNFWRNNSENIDLTTKVVAIMDVT